MSPPHRHVRRSLPPVAPPKPARAPCPLCKHPGVRLAPSGRFERHRRADAPSTWCAGGGLLPADLA